MFHWLKEWHQNRIVRNSAISQAEWQAAIQPLTLLQRLNTQEIEKLKRLATLFLHYKSIEGIGELEITTNLRLNIALQACLLILNLGLDWYAGWISVIIYPGNFSYTQKEIDEYGIVHLSRANLSGESWLRGPVILSWDEVCLSQGENGGRNVVIHEFAHKLDMLNGHANGYPPLHKEMSTERWSEVFNQAYLDLEQRLEQNSPIPIDAYAATSPSEFFAVFSELFFKNPAILKDYYPEVFILLSQFYRQNPLIKHA
ncbi:Protein MtfA [Legionella nautarum]|uniref:Protein MtfA n=1 Tax=Legionella nautarum TaxID=45070 RepID=A0A0W0WUQ5_9GAMM|nr:M90 family metallopeptidase [Legionella nautarum]KTD36045.1 Protein MtfA [Legionella nautarum]